MSSNPTLPLTQNEKTKLRKSKVKISKVHTFSIDKLVQMMDISVEKARIIKGLAEFQNVPSIGYKLAEKLVYKLNIYSLNEIKDKNGADLFDELEQRLNVWTDSCVEDQIHCVINYANDSNSSLQWFDFTNERKNYREKVGYPETRPKTAWYEGEKNENKTSTCQS
ncbi:helix-hairpin-helix domain-containing protein [Lysinibacillus sp. NPDC097231]|uniref:helix-hairpin-helix domain-containing protein n=1 Tax=Lysinibacillus sp. NPDC097231 TaxID=3364142 RepID=UPI003810EA03